MSEYSDIYVISKGRNAKTINQFIELFLPKREECADEYYIPQYIEPTEITFYTAEDLIEYCCENELTENSIYWRALEGHKPEYGMVYFLRDGSTIYGLSTESSNEPLVEKFFKELKMFLNSEVGYTTWENSPEPETFEEFESYANNKNP